MNDFHPCQNNEVVSLGTILSLVCFILNGFIITEVVEVAHENAKTHRQLTGA
jgi:hypothetical protein